MITNKRIDNKAFKIFGQFFRVLSNRSNLRLVGTATRHPSCTAPPPRRRWLIHVCHQWWHDAVLPLHGWTWMENGTSPKAGNSGKSRCHVGSLADFLVSEIKCLWKVLMTLKTSRFFQSTICLNYFKLLTPNTSIFTLLHMPPQVRRN